MPALVYFRRLLRRLSRPLLPLLFASAACAQINLGLNPIVSTGTQTLGATDFFTGTLTINGSGSLSLSADYSATLPLVFSGTGSYLTYSSSIRTLTLLTTASLTRSGTGATYVYDNLANNSTVTVSGGTLQFQGGTTLINTAGATSTVTGSGSTLYLAGLANAGSLVADSLGLIQLAGSFTTANLGSISLTNGGIIRLTGTLNNASATLTAPSGGAYTLYGGTITGGTIANGALTFTGSTGYLDGATYTGDLTLPASTSVRFLNGATFTGTNLTLGSNSGLYWQQISTLAAKSLSFGSSSYLYLSGTNSAITLDSATTATGQIQIYHDGSAGTAITNQGTLNQTTGSGQIYAHTVTNSGTFSQTGGSTSIYADTFTNSGTISATTGTLYLGYPSAGYNTTNTSSGSITSSGSGTNIYLRGNFANSGSLTAQNSGLLTFDGANTTANLGAITLATGGRVRLNGTLNNTSATLSAPSGGTFDLLGGTITGGTIATGTLTFTSSGGYLDGVTYTGDLSLPTSTYVRLLNGTTFTGANLTLAAGSGLYWQQAATLASRALSFAASSYLYLSGFNSSLTLDSATTATGQIQIYHDGSTGTAITNQGTLTNTSGSAQIYAHTVTNSGSYFQTGGSGNIYADTFTNSGTISATTGTLYLGYPSAGYNTTNTSSGSITSDGSGTNIYLRGNFANSGSITAQNSGILTFDGANTTANLGAITLTTGGRVRLNGTLNNTGATLTAPSGGTFDLLGGTITGGTIATGALTFTSSGGYLDGVTYAGNVTLPTSAQAYITGGTTFGGTAITLGNSAYLYWQQTGTLSGQAITLAPGAALYLSGVSRSLTLAADTTVTGNTNVYSDGSIGSSITNLGSITNSNSSTGYLYARSFTNSGNIAATSGTLYLGASSTGYAFTNTAGSTITANGGNIVIQAPVGNPVINQGAINVQSGTLFTSNLLTNGTTGTITGAGTINGNLAVPAGTLAPGNNGIGTLSLLGSLTLGSGANTVFELNGTNSDRITGISTLTLGGQFTLYALSTAFSSGQTWNLFSATTITGNFSSFNLPYTNDGWVWDTSQLGTTGNLVLTTFVPVPEPSTYLLLAAGLSVIFALRRHRIR
jgi:fibronectin-binding autotransporter adhesin